MTSRKLDYGRSVFETNLLELDGLFREIADVYGNVDKWVKPDPVPFDMQWTPMKPKVLKMPKGVVLIIGPFNVRLRLDQRRIVADHWTHAVPNTMYSEHCGKIASLIGGPFCSVSQQACSVGWSYCRWMCRRRQDVGANAPRGCARNGTVSQVHGYGPLPHRERRCCRDYCTSGPSVGP